MAGLQQTQPTGLPLREIAVTAWQNLKAAAFQFVSRSTWRFWSTNTRTQRNYPELVGNGSSSSIAVACVLWACRAFPEAPVIVSKKLPKNQREIVDNFPMVKLIKRPNPYYSGNLLWHATLGEYIFNGNAYWIKIRNQIGGGRGQPFQLWWVPGSTIEPKWPEDGSAFISHYEYNPNGKEIFRIDPSDIVHFRFGFDPLNIRKGLSPIASCLREIYTDDEAANFTASILSNLGVPGLVISPAEGTKINQTEADNMKLMVKDKFSGDKRGEPLILSHKGTVSVVGYNPQQMDLKTVRRFPEERLSAVIGIPAIVAGLGAGLDRSTFANFKEAREAGYESFLIPTQRSISDDLDVQLLPDFGDTDKLETGFDLSRVRALQEDQDLIHKRAQDDYARSIATLNEARVAAGYEPLGPDGDVFSIPVNMIITPKDQLIAPEPEPTTESENDDGSSEPDSDSGDSSDNAAGSNGNSPVDDTESGDIPVKSNGHSKETRSLVKV